MVFLKWSNPPPPKDKKLNRPNYQAPVMWKKDMQKWYLLHPYHNPNGLIAMVSFENNVVRVKSFARNDILQAAKSFILLW